MTLCLAVTYLLEEVTLEVDEVVGLDNVGAAFTAEHSGKQRFHGWRALPSAHHGIGYLEVLEKMNTIQTVSSFKSVFFF